MLLGRKSEHSSNNNKLMTGAIFHPWELSQVENPEKQPSTEWGQKYMDMWTMRPMSDLDNLL